jgi:hypothetical protein
MIKLVLDAEIGDILGAHMIGAEVTELLGRSRWRNCWRALTRNWAGWFTPTPRSQRPSRRPPWTRMARPSTFIVHVRDKRWI